ncbi:MAG: hypothetical protein H6587_07910 [Flavobacteriales bacterium]|nr:hypothetical protein [Flavobacteriales bacterium]MCB9364477.1 hypothetical protein [Flavobacteriales bacterium]
MKIKFILPLTLSVIIFGCSSPSENTEDVATHETETSIEITETEHHHEELEAIVLDNGNKWKVVETMIVYIRNIEKAVNSFEGTESKDYTALAKTIDENLIELTSSCTMEGQAHDELHKWLVPFIELSEQFDVATELTEQERIYNDFKTAFVEFNTYFE